MVTITITLLSVGAVRLSTFLVSGRVIFSLLAKGFMVESSIFAVRRGERDVLPDLLKSPPIPDCFIVVLLLLLL